MTAAEITERQVARVRALTNLTEEQCSRDYILYLLQRMYPSGAAVYILSVSHIKKTTTDEARLCIHFLNEQQSKPFPSQATEHTRTTVEQTRNWPVSNYEDNPNWP